MKRSHVIALAFAALPVAVAFFVRAKVASYYESAEFRTHLGNSLAGGLSLLGGRPAVEVVSVNAHGWYDFTLPEVRLKFKGLEDRRASAEVTVDLWPHLLSRKVAVGVAGSLAGQGQFSLAAILDLRRLDAVERGSVSALSAFTALTGQWHDVPASLLTELIGRGSGRSAVALASGKVAGDLALASGPLLNVGLKLQSLKWRVQLHGTDREIDTDDLAIGLVFDGREVRLKEPVVWRSPVGAARLTGRLVLAKNGEMAYDLQAEAKSPLAKIAVAAMFGCQATAGGLKFKVKGPVSGARCQ